MKRRITGSSRVGQMSADKGKTGRLVDCRQKDDYEDDLIDGYENVLDKQV